MKHKKRFYLFFSILTLVFLLTLTSCQTDPVLYNVNTMYTATAFGFTDDGEARVNVSYTGYQSTKNAIIDIKIEKQGFLFFWNTIAQETLTADTEDYQNECFYPITEDGNYRCTVTYTVSGTGEDDVIIFKDEKTYRKENSYAQTTDTSLTETTSTETTVTETTESTTTETTTTEIVTTEPPESEEEKALRLRYEAAVEALNEYLANDTDDQETLKYLYTEFEALGDYEDSEMYFSRFTELSDMLTGIVLTKINAKGQPSETKVGGYTYNQNGQITSAFGEEMRKIYNISDQFEHVFNYDENGKLLSIQVVDSIFIKANLIAEYDKDGNLIKLMEKNNSQTRNYFFNKNGQIEKCITEVYTHFGTTASTQTCIYSYYENGNIYQISYENYEESYTPLKSFSSDTKKDIYRYQCDENGVITQMTVTTTGSHLSESKVYDYENKVFSYGQVFPSVKTETERYDIEPITVNKKFTYDENGRILSAEIIDESKPNIEQYLTYEYETLYFYQK